MSKKTLILFIIFSLLIGWQLLRPGYYSMHDDLQVMRLYEMDRCFKDGQIPCRWAPDLVNNDGQPLFNFYSAFPYYLGELFHAVGFSFVDTVKLLFLLSLFLSGVFVYLLSVQFVSSPAAIVAGLAYMVAPYHAVDIFVRGAMAESWGLALVPAVLLSLVLVFRRPSVYTSACLSFSLAALLTTHHITTLITAPIFILTTIFLFLGSREKRKSLAYLLLGLSLGTGLAAFFLLPVLFERHLIDQSFLTSDYFDFRAHFASLSQLFTKLSWGYGPSRFNSVEYPQTLSFFIGVLPAITLLVSPLLLWQAWRDKNLRLTLFFLISLSLFYLFMSHAKSIAIWEAFPTLAFVQFPWRFLGPASLLISLLIGFMAQLLIEVSGKNEKALIAFLVAFLVAANFPYFRFEKYYEAMTDQLKLSGPEYEAQIRGAMLDYLPKNVAIPENKAMSQPEIISGKVDINYFDKRSNFFASEFDVLSEEAEVRFPVMYFPGWTVYLDRKPTPAPILVDNPYGQITVKLSKGHRVVQAFFENTPARSAGNLVTLISAFTLTIILVRNEQKDED